MTCATQSYSSCAEMPCPACLQLRYFYRFCLALASKINVNTIRGEVLESGHSQATLGHKAAGNQVSSMPLLLTELFSFLEIRQCVMKFTDSLFFVDNLYLSFLEVLVCIQNKKRETDLCNSLADAHLHFSLKNEQLFILTLSRAKQM